MSDPPTTLLISSKNYSSWSLRGWLLLRLSGLPFAERMVAADDAAVRDELLLRASSIRVPCLLHDGVQVWDTLAIAEYLNELLPDAADAARRAGRPRPLPLDLRRDAFRVRGDALVAADEPARAPARLRGVVGGARRHRADLHDLARVPGDRGAAPGCSASAAAWPTRCMRRS